jgi:hypothetical protein
LGAEPHTTAPGLLDPVPQVVRSNAQRSTADRAPGRNDRPDQALKSAPIMGSAATIWVAVPLHNPRVGVVLRTIQRPNPTGRHGLAGSAATASALRSSPAASSTRGQRHPRSFARDPYLVPNLTRRGRWVSAGITPSTKGRARHRTKRLRPGEQLCMLEWRPAVPSARQELQRVLRTDARTGPGRHAGDGTSVGNSCRESLCLASARRLVGD